MRIFLYRYTSMICITIIPINFNRNDLFEILCLKMSIPINAPTVPPKKVRDNKVASGIRRWCFTAFRLSVPKMIKVMMLMKAIA